MALAWREIPHAVHHDLVDIGDLERLRRREAENVPGAKLTLTPFLVKALASALQMHPQFNAAFDSERDEIEIKRSIHVGVALDSENGLLVPVLRDADRKNVLSLALELNQIAETLRNGRPRGGVLKGGTFTLTNVGALGGSGFSPIINPPQVAIFGAARASLQQVVRGDLDDPKLEVALRLPVCVAFDHRVLDGADAARFMNSVKDLLSSPDRLVMRS